MSGATPRPAAALPPAVVRHLREDVLPEAVRAYERQRAEDRAGLAALAHAVRVCAFPEDPPPLVCVGCRSAAVEEHEIHCPACGRQAQGERRGKRADLSLRATTGFSDGALRAGAPAALVDVAAQALGRLRGLLARPEVVAFLAAEEVFGGGYEEGLRADVRDLALALGLCPRPRPPAAAAAALAALSSAARPPAPAAPEPAAPRRVIVVVDDIDRHGEGHDCGLCNANGKSWGAAVFDLADRPAGSDPDWYRNADPLDRVYAPSEQSAAEAARIACGQEGWEVVVQDDEGGGEEAPF